MSTESLAAVDRVLRAVDRAVWVVTARNGAAQGGLLATFVVGLSIDAEAPLLGVSIDPHHFTHDLILRSGAFVAHLLRPDQLDLAWRFGLTSGAEGDKLAGLEVVPAPETAAPRLVDCLGWVEARCAGSVELGGRTFFIAELATGDLTGSASPLTEQQLFASATPAQRELAKSQKTADAQQSRGAAREWLNAMKAARDAS